MTKKDYELIAGILKHQKPNVTNTYEADLRQRLWAHTVQDFTSVLELENPKFDRDKFLQACGIEVSNVR